MFFLNRPYRSYKSYRTYSILRTSPPPYRIIPDMYCPSCGSEERQLSQFCRACGTDLRVVRNSLENPDAITQRVLDSNVNRSPYEMPAPGNLTNELAPAPRHQPSITEHTTHHLKSSKS